MSDLFTVLRKESLEWASVSRAGFLQIAMVIAVLGVYLPFTQPALWSAPTATAGLTLFFIFPSILTASVAADAFAGERERKTLETLFATPLTDAAIFYGKAAWAVLYAASVAAVALGCSVVTASLRAGAVEAVPLWGAAATAVAGAVVTAAAAIIISSRVAVAKSAQQLTTLFTLACAGGMSGLMHLRGTRLPWRLLYAGDFLFFAAGLIALALAAVSFRRDRLFDRR